MNTNYQFVDELDFAFIEDRRKLRDGKWISIVREFIKSDKKYCIIPCGTEEAQKSCLNSLRAVKTRHHLDIVIGKYKANAVYIAKG